MKHIAVSLISFSATFGLFMIFSSFYFLMFMSKLRHDLRIETMQNNWKILRNDVFVLKYNEQIQFEFCK